MAQIQLAANEYMLSELQNVMERHGVLTKVGNLMVTNQRIIFSKTGAFGISKVAGEWPITDVKVFDGTAQVKVTSVYGTQTKLDIYLRSGQLSYFVNGAGNSEVSVFANEVNHAATGTDEDVYSGEGNAKGLKAIAQVFRGSMAEEAQKVDKSKQQKIALKCPHCGGSFEGVRGKTAKCPYCDSIYNA